MQNGSPLEKSIALLSVHNLFNILSTKFVENIYIGVQEVDLLKIL